MCLRLSLVVAAGSPRDKRIRARAWLEVPKVPTSKSRASLKTCSALDNPNDPFRVSNRVWTRPGRIGQGPGTNSFRTTAFHHKKYHPGMHSRVMVFCSFSFRRHTEVLILRFPRSRGACENRHPFVAAYGFVKSNRQGRFLLHL